MIRIKFIQYVAHIFALILKYLQEYSNDILIPYFLVFLDIFV